MNNAFLNRFRSVWARKRRVELGQVVAGSLLLALIGLSLLAIADYSLELDRSARVVALGAMFGAVALFAINSLWRTMRRWIMTMRWSCSCCWNAWANDYERMDVWSAMAWHRFGVRRRLPPMNRCLQ